MMMTVMKMMMVLMMIVLMMIDNHNKEHADQTEVMSRSMNATWSKRALVSSYHCTLPTSCDTNE